MFSKLTLLSLFFVAAVSVNGMSYDDFVMERELATEMLDAREPFEPVYADIREAIDFPEAREPSLAEIREVLELLALEARAPVPAPHKHNHKHNHKQQPKKKHVHKHNTHKKVVVVKHKLVQKPKHNHKHKANKNLNNGNNNKVVLVKQAPVTKTITVNGAKQTIVQQAGGPTITLAPQGTVTVFQGKTYTVAKAKPTSPINRLLKQLGAKKNAAQAVSASGSMKVYAFLGALTAVGALFA